jgi:hypothetical protein
VKNPCTNFRPPPQPSSRGGGSRKVFKSNDPGQDGRAIYKPCPANQRSASIAAMQPLPAAVTACR